MRGTTESGHFSAFSLLVSRKVRWLDTPRREEGDGDMVETVSLSPYRANRTVANGVTPLRYAYIKKTPPERDFFLQPVRRRPPRPLDSP
jgi:hypothetical protein